jgi:2-furoyl-CoA dehydrogenase large subunit
MADGQIRGAFAQGLGAALLEEFRYGADGSFQSGTFADYLMPTACEVPDPHIVHLQTPSPFTPLGAKGIGEGNNMSTPVCIANAFVDALEPLAGRIGNTLDIRLPLTPSKVLALLAFTESSAPTSLSKIIAARASSNVPGGLSLHSSGSISIAASPEKVFSVLLNSEALARVIPGCHALVQVGENSYRADITVGVGLVKARYKASIVLSDIDAPHSLRLAGQGISSLGTGAGSGTVRLEATKYGCKLHYDYAAQVGGKVAAVGSRMLDGAAKIILAQLFASLGRQATGAKALTWWQRLVAVLGVKA